MGERKRGLRHRDDMDRRTPGGCGPIAGLHVESHHLLVVFENLGRSDGFSGSQAPDPGRGGKRGANCARKMREPLEPSSRSPQVGNAEEHGAR